MSFRTLQISIATLALVAVAFGCTAEDGKSKAGTEVKLDNPKSRISYTIGVNIGRDFINQGMDIDPDLLLVGLRDAMAEKEIKMTDEEMAAEVQTFQQQMMAKAEADMQKAAGENLTQPVGLTKHRTPQIPAERGELGMVSGRGVPLRDAAQQVAHHLLEGAELGQDLWGCHRCARLR